MNFYNILTYDLGKDNICLLEREPYQRTPAKPPFVQCEDYIYGQAQVACT